MQSSILNVVIVKLASAYERAILVRLFFDLRLLLHMLLPAVNVSK